MAINFAAARPAACTSLTSILNADSMTLILQGKTIVPNIQ